MNCWYIICRYLINLVLKAKYWYVFITTALCHSKPKLGIKYQILNSRYPLRSGYEHSTETSKVED